MTSDKDLVIEQMNTQFQKGGDDYGLFAIAYSHDTMLWGNPADKNAMSPAHSIWNEATAPFPFCNDFIHVGIWSSEFLYTNTHFCRYKNHDVCI